MARMKKSDIIAILVNEYGCEESEIKNKKYNDLLAMLTHYENSSEDLRKEHEREVRRRKIFTVDPETPIPVMSNTYGTLVHTSDRYGNWIFTEYGQIEEMPMAELIRMDHRNRRALTRPNFIILEPDPIKQLRLEDVYKKILKPDEVEELFNKPADEFRKILESLAEGMKDVIKSIAHRKYENEELTDLKKIKAIEEICKTQIHYG